MRIMKRPSVQLEIVNIKSSGLMDVVDISDVDANKLLMADKDNPFEMKYLAPSGTSFIIRNICYVEPGKYVGYAEPVNDCI